MNISEFNTYLQNLPDKIKDVVPDIVANEAVEYYKDTFSKKAFDGNPWLAGKPKKRGSLLVQSSALMNSIRADEVSDRRVVIAAGNDKVRYARAHNEGVDEIVTVQSHTRIKGGRTKKVVRGGDVSTVKTHSRHACLPRRQHISKSANQQIKKLANQKNEQRNLPRTMRQNQKGMSRNPVDRLGRRAT